MVRSKHVRTCFSKNRWARKKDIFKSKYDTMTPFLTQKGVYLCLVPDLVMRESPSDYINWWWCKWRTHSKVELLHTSWENLSLISALSWLKSINSRADERWNQSQWAACCCSPLVLVSSVSSQSYRGRGWEENISLLSFGGRFSNMPGEVSYYVSRLTFCW